MGKGLSESDLKALVASEMRSSLGYSSSKLSAARQKAEYYYLGLAVGDLAKPEIDGRSGVVSTDVRDTIESMLPQLMVTFCGGDKVAEFEPQTQDDEKRANLATEYVNYLFFKKNNGHKLSYVWMKDALLQKNGIVKVWWDTRHEEKKEEYKALDQFELAQIMEDPEVEVTEQTSYPDEDDAKARQKALEDMQPQMMQAMQAAQQGDPKAAQALQQMQQHMEQIQAQPPVMLYDITAKRVKTDGKITIENVPPEEFLISRNAKDIPTAKFVGHRVQRTVSELKSMGYKNVDNMSGEDQGQAINGERIQRLSWNDENAYMSDEVNTSDESQRRIWVTECYVRCDFDGDGISELRKVTVAGNELLDNEEVDFTPFVSITPIPLPHTFFGLSVADLVMEKMRSKTSLLRAAHDNTYLEANGRYFAEEGVNLDDLMTSRPGGVVRVKRAGSVGRLDQGAGNTSKVMELLDYTEQELEKASGWSRYSQGNDAQGLNDTATGMNIITNKADMRIDMIARNFAEGFTELFGYVLKLVCQHQNKKQMVRIAGEWAEIDPREWRNGFDTQINVGIGMGNKDQKVQHMMALIGQQEKVFPLGVATPSNILESSKELAKLLGYKNGDKFFNDPVKNPPPPKPDPEKAKLDAMMQMKQMDIQASGQAAAGKAQMDAQIKQMEMQFKMQADEADRAHTAQLEQMKAQMQAEVDNNRQRSEAEQKTLEMQQQAQLAAIKAQYDDAKHLRDVEFERWKIELQTAADIEKANIASKAKLNDAATSTATAEVAREVKP